MDAGVALYDPSTDASSNEALRGLNSFTVIPIVAGAESDPVNMRVHHQDCTIDTDAEIEGGDPNAGVERFELR